MKTSKDLDFILRQKNPKVKLNCAERGNTKVPSSTSIAKFKSVNQNG